MLLSGSASRGQRRSEAGRGRRTAIRRATQRRTARRAPRTSSVRPPRAGTRGCDTECLPPAAGPRSTADPASAGRGVAAADRALAGGFSVRLVLEGVGRPAGPPSRRLHRARRSSRRRRHAAPRSILFGSAAAVHRGQAGNCRSRVPVARRPTYAKLFVHASTNCGTSVAASRCPGRMPARQRPRRGRHSAARTYSVSLFGDDEASVSGPSGSRASPNWSHGAPTGRLL